jgi:tRNA-uridine 2-sulfurtransferase
MKAIALISGGLDSLLAAQCVQRSGIEIIPLYFQIPFCHGASVSLGVADSLPQKVQEALGGVVLRQIDLRDDFLVMLKKPRYGFGAHMNPCIDCKILMLSKAKALMKEWGASFVVTGEVLGQRPMSQHRNALATIEQRSGLTGLLLRPLSAQHLPKSIPEKEGWIAASALFDFSGRSRKPQIKLADALKLANYPNPSGGCLLTDAGFSNRLKDLIKHRELSLEEIELLRFGRHFRLTPHAKLIVGRNEKENGVLEQSAKQGDYLFFPTQEMAGPTALGRGNFNEKSILLSATITCRYCDLGDLPAADILCRKLGEEVRVLGNVIRVKDADIAQMRL